jgi:IS30 family transposase
MWERWRAGESLQHIAQLFDRNHSSVAGILAQTGGIQPPPRRRSKRSLTLAEREEISRGLAADDSIQSIARRLSRAPSTICREIKRNSGEKGYRADFGDELAWQRALRPKPCKLVATPALAKIVAAKLQLEWSPQQVAGWLKRTWPGNEGFHVSHETIYRTLFIQARGALKKELLEHLRRTRAMRRSRHHTQKTEDHGPIRDAVSISERPATVEDRAVPGHWEGDLLCGSGNSQIATLVERHTRYVMLVEIDSKETVKPWPTRSSNTPASFRKSSTNRLPGIAAPRWRGTNGSPSPLTLPCISVTPSIRGNAAPMRIRTGC